MVLMVGSLMIWRRGVWPMLRTIPNDTHASLQQAFGPMDLPALQIDGLAVTTERVRSVAIDGTLAIRTRACATPCADGDGALGLVRTIFPSRDKDAIVETIEVTNLTRRRLGRDVRGARAGRAHGSRERRGRGVRDRGRRGSRRELDAGVRTRRGRTRSSIPRAAPPIRPSRSTPRASWRPARRGSPRPTAASILETPDPVLDKAFAFAKVRATESIFATKGGLMHGPGGGRYYAAIWANDQAEYANPFFGYLGEGNPRASALNAFRHFARFMNPATRRSPARSSRRGRARGTARRTAATRR